MEIDQLTAIQNNISEALKYASPELVNNNLFTVELNRILGDYSKKVNVKVYENGRKVVIYEKPEKLVVDHLDVLQVGSYCFSITPSGDITYNHQKGILDKDRRDSKYGHFRYELDCSLYTNDGVEMNRVRYVTSNEINTAKDFGPSTLRRETNNRMPIISFGEGYTKFNPGLYAYNADLTCYNRTIDSLGVVNVIWKKIDGAGENIDVEVMENSIYPANSYEPGFIRISGDALSKNGYTEYDLPSVVDKTNRKFYSEADGYGADTVREYIRKFIDIDDEKTI